MDGREAIHAALTAVIAWFGIVLSLPGETFAISHTFDVMASLAREDHWAMALWLVACFGLIGMFTPSMRVRLGSVLLLSTMHGVIALCFALASPRTTGSGTYGILAGLGYYLAYRRTTEGV